jgi:CO/xanthine dehydrogenase Mo-binding subunit
MTRPGGPALTRRAALAGGGLVVMFSLTGTAVGQNEQKVGAGEEAGPTQVLAADLPGSLKTTPLLDSWIAVDPQGGITVFTGKAELGQGIRTALIQVAAEELDVAPAQIHLVTADTGRTPNEGFTAGSHSMQDSGSAIRSAAANVREMLAAAAAAQWGVTPDAVASTGEGGFRAADGRTLSYGAVAGGLELHVAARPDVPLKGPNQLKVMGQSLPRVDIPAKLTGGVAYVQDLRLPGMLHARVIRGPSEHTVLKSPDVAAVRAMPGVVTVVRNGRFTAVVAEREWTAVQAWRRLQAGGWTAKGAPLPAADTWRALQAAPGRTQVILDVQAPVAPTARSLKVRYTRPWLMHASIGPSCAVALYKDGVMTVWSHTQGVYPLRGALAQLLKLPPDKVRCIQVEGSGCYGHNGADDVAGDAALAALALPGRPVRLQWMREQEHGWEPLGPAMVVEAEAALDAGGRIADWRYDVWSTTHIARPGSAGSLLAGQELDPPFPPDTPKEIPMPEGGGDRNAVPLYVLPSAHVVDHFVTTSPMRSSALRSLGAHMNVFCVESLMDELARTSGQDPVAFRQGHLQDPRARDVVSLCAEKFGWSGRPRGDGRRGCGFAFARYKNLASYCAVALEVEVERETGRTAVRRVVAAVDSGTVVNPDGVRNQIEGAIVQSLSWTGLEAVAFDEARRTSFDWSAYPIARFRDVPDGIVVHLLDRPGEPFLGAGEAGQGPAAAALANAICDATGLRLRDLPLSPERVKAAIGF